MKKFALVFCLLAASMSFSCFLVKPKDTTAPSWSLGYPALGTVQATSASILVKTDEACAVWALALPSGSASPSGDAIVAQGLKLPDLPANTERGIVLTGLSATTAYDVYLIAEDGMANRQADPRLISLETTEAAAPAWVAGYPLLDAVQSTSASVLVRTDEASTVWTLALADGSTAPTAADILNQGSSTTGIPADTEFTVTVSGLANFTAYDLYLLAEDAHGNVQAAPVSLELLTANALAPAWESGGQPVAGSPLPTGAAIVLTASEDCTVYYLVLADGSPAPSPDTLIGTGTAVTGILAGEEETINLTGLDDSTSYDVYFIAVDGEGNPQSAPSLVEFTTTDGTPPAWAATYPKTSSIGYTAASVLLRTDEASTAYLLILPDGSAAPTASELRFHSSAVSVACAAGVEAARTFTGLDVNTPYDLYAVAQDAAGNLQSAPVLLEFQTQLDTTAPAWQAGYPRLDTTSATGADILVRTDEACSVYALALADGAAAPTSEQIIAAPTATRTINGGTQSIFTVGSLNPVTNYDIYVVAADASGNRQASPVKIDALTITVEVDVVLIPEGTNVSIGWVGIYRGEPVHTVPTISAFRMARYETTFALWAQVRDWALTHGYTFQKAGTNGDPSGALDTDCPVVGVTWSDVFAWCNAFSEYNGYEPAYFTDRTKATVYRDSTDSTCELVVVGTTYANSCVNWSASGYRLPTSAEWEYASRLRADGSLSDGDKPAGCDSADTGTWDDYAWIGETPVDGAPTPKHPVGQLLPTAYGLYDMTGNVWEFCWDWLGDYVNASPFTDPDTHGPAQAISTDPNQAWKVMRGSSLFADIGNDLYEPAVSNRHSQTFTTFSSDVGFRLVRNE